MVACKRCLWVFLFLIIRRPPRSTRTDTLFPYTTLFRSCPAGRSGGIFLRPVRLAVADLAAQPPDDAEDIHESGCRAQHENQKQEPRLGYQPPIEEQADADADDERSDERRVGKE